MKDPCSFIHQCQFHALLKMDPDLPEVFDSAFLMLSMIRSPSFFLRNLLEKNIFKSLHQVLFPLQPPLQKWTDFALNPKMPAKRFPGNRLTDLLYSVTTSLNLSRGYFYPVFRSLPIGIATRGSSDWLSARDIFHIDQQAGQCSC
jgi:hypothetical protein